MKNQPNEIVTLEWLLPLFNQQLSQVSDGWQVNANSNFERIGQCYREISDTLTMVNLPRLATVAAKLGLLAEAGSLKILDANQRRIGAFAHQLLQHELTQYAQLGTYRSVLLDKTIDRLVQMLLQIKGSTDNNEASKTPFAANECDVPTQTIDVVIPNVSTVSGLSLTTLEPAQYQQLLLVWRQQVQQLLAANINQSTILASLKKVSGYLWQISYQTNNHAAHQRLWYLTEVWLSNLAENSLPLPAFYAPLLAQLDHVLNSRYQQPVEFNDHSTTHSSTHSTISVDNRITPAVIEGLIADLYIQISSLGVINDQAQKILSQSSQNQESHLRFLPRMLVEIEAVILGLDKPQMLIDSLQQLKRQFGRRGWIRYESQVSRILTDLTDSMTSETVFVQRQSQIEGQLQALYSAIYKTEQAIQSKIGQAVSFIPRTSSTAPITIDKQEAPEAFIVSTDDSLRQLRIAVEDIKCNFSNYVQHQQTYLLPTSEVFIEMGNAFDDMELSSIRHVSDKLGELFAKLETHKIKNISWQLTQALAEAVTAIELLLYYLAQQVFDQHLLQQADDHIEQSYKWIEVVIAAPDETVAYISIEPIKSNVIRYDDSGEIVPHHDALDRTEGQIARAQTKPDNFEMDEEIRDIFIEEATDVLIDLGSFLSIWQQDSQELSPLMEIRRGFHTLKGSGRMVGAFSISEMAWAIESLLNRILDNILPVTEETVALVAQTTESLTVLVTDFTALQAPSIDPAITVLQSNNLLAGRSLSYGLNNLIDDQQNITNTSSVMPFIDSSDGINNLVNNFVSNCTDLSISNHPISASPLNSPAILEPFIQQTSPLPIDAQNSDPEIKEIFIEEAEEVLADITPRYQQWRTMPSDLTELKVVRRGFHTLKGSGRMVGAYYSAELAWAIEGMLNRILDYSVTLSEDIMQLIADVLSAYPDLIKTFANNNEDYHQDYPAIVPLWVACAHAYSKQQGDKFRYIDLRTNWLIAGTQQLVSNNNSGYHDGNDNSNNSDNNNNNSDNRSSPDNTDSMLKTMNSVNEIMAEAPAITTLQTEEEKAFCEIFVEEAQTLLQDISDFVSLHHDENYIEVTDEIVRAFHTLRAASGSNALSAISDISAIIEYSLEQLQNHDTPMNAQHLQALAQSIALINNYLDAYNYSQKQQNLPIENLQNKQDLASLQAMFGETESTSLASDNKLSITQLLEIGIDTLLDAEWELHEALNTDCAEQVQAYVQQQIQQIEQLAATTKESSKFTLILEALVGVYRYLYSNLLDNNLDAAHDTEIQRTLLAGHQQLVGLFDALAGSMSLKVDQQVLSNLQAIIAIDADSDMNYLDSNHDANDANDALASHNDNETAHDKTDSINTESINTESINTDEASTTVQSIQSHELQLEAIDTDAELLEIFLEEAQNLDSAIAQSFSKWRDDIDNMSVLKALQRHLHIIKGGARMAGIRSIGDLTHEAESIYEAFVEERLVPTAQWLTIMQMVQGTLSLQIDYVGRYQETFFAYELIEQLQQFEQSNQLPKAITLILPALQNYKNDDADAADAAEDKRKSIEQASDTVSLESFIAESWSDNLPDPDILEVFLEEADELLVSSNQCLQLFLNNISDVSALQILQRDLHTMKGGARMVAANGIADLAHEMETVYEELAIRRRPATKMVSQLLTACHDWLADAISILKQHVNPSIPTALIIALQQFSKNPDDLKYVPNESLQAQRRMILAAQMQQHKGHVVENINEMPPMSGSFDEQEQSAGNDEMIRISGGVIEHMINLSGESAINRARIDMGMSSLTNSIEEMGTTVQRLADQLRRMEIELEAQVLSQIDDAELMNTEDFDPLEMDQYSSLNQLSKSLTESASDLIDIKSTLLEKTRDSESLLLQLSRTQTELQAGLMNSRMVPFTRLTPRLERIVRQTANELNKSVELKIINADDEIDKTILERITSPLEHMLRNAIDHGIEDTQTRLTAGKARSGHITLEVLREGSEVVVNLTDDGRGINVNAVRKKAIAQGFIDANDESLTDLDIMQYIFKAGLTTTQHVTQISGRGVGMDVVISEIRQLGGMVAVTSEEGQGSRFTMRVPLTVAISDALVVRAADRYYAIPLVQIERVIRINPEKLYDYYESGAATLHIEDDDYRIRYLNEILSGSKLSELMVSTNTSLPLIIIKNRAGQKLALQVDQIAGSRIEVVVKPLGRQLSHLAGISAATIMGDGSVMLILDLIALMRNAPAQNVTHSATLERRHRESQITVLVVDDSVTVRKVTSRLLERQGINVAIAKDGIDAMEILQETVPDLILLDIEMPRMDGFEVATQVRHNERLRQIPIIMITSRTGEKHRTRALEIGVNDYMGKPFQENELLNRMQALLGKKLVLSQED